jgi:hypothetical protein
VGVRPVVPTRDPVFRFHRRHHRRWRGRQEHSESEITLSPKVATLLIVLLLGVLVAAGFVTPDVFAGILLRLKT